MSFAKIEHRFAVSEDYDIPFADHKKQPDSMLNCDFARFNKILSKRMTLSGKARKVSRFESFFNTKKSSISSTQQLIRGLKHIFKLNTKKEIPKKKCSFTTSTNNISQNFGINNIILKLKSKSAHNLESQLLEQPRNVGDACPLDNIRTIEEHEFTIIPEEISDVPIKEARRKVKAGSRICSRVQNRYRTLKNKQSEFNYMSMNSNLGNASRYCPIEESDNKMFNCSSDEDFDEEVLNNSFSETGLIEMNANSDLISKSKDQFYKLLLACETSDIKRSAKFQVALSEAFVLLINSSEGINIFKGIFNSMKTEAMHIQFFKHVNLIDIAFTLDCCKLEEVFENLALDTADMDLVYSIFNSSLIWKQLIQSKYGKNIVEYFLKEFYCEYPLKHSLLFGIIDSNFIDYALSNYTTFVVQNYINYFARDISFKLIMKNFEQLSITRNGVFVLIAGLKGFKQSKLEQLLDKIIDNSEYLCTNKYASTMMEYTFMNFGLQVCDKFIEKKLYFLYGKLIFSLIKFY